MPVPGSSFISSTTARSVMAVRAVTEPAPTQPGEGLSTVQDESGTSVHHTGSTEPLPEDKTVRALARAQAHFQSSEWSVRHVQTRGGTPAVVARHPEEGTIAQVAASATGAVRVAVTTPANGPASADV
ncbi:hypothetical protein [Streptomyces sp. NPDC056227]|uniref:hypothetical protein n=1 Tax=Streptomyces sp. NPDC056227 TaxID=3345753 RepID=UPI0035D7C557